MDIFYYWKDFNADRKAGRLGYFRSTRSKLAEFQAGAPDDIWIFKTPAGCKGELQLLGRLRWSDKAVRTLKREPSETYMLYDPDHADSVLFPDSGTEDGIAAITRWMGVHFPASLRGNFQGELGQQALRGTALVELKRISVGFSKIPFMSG